MNPDRYLVKPGHSLDLTEVDPAEHHFWTDKEAAAEATLDLADRLGHLQERLYAGREQALLVILQGMDTSGKDGTIRHVMSGVNPQGCQVTSFKVPTPEEAAHDFLWRIHARTPARGMLGIFNRSHYEDVTVTRVHRWITGKQANHRFKSIRHFEHHLARNGTLIVKFFLHISKDEQKRRLMKRVENPEKRWKFNLGDLKERESWGRYRKAYEEAISETSVEEAPWYVVPADNKWYRNWVVAKVLVKALEGLKLGMPKADPRINFSKIRIR